MWYVVQVMTGSEEFMQKQCQEQLSPEVLTECFVPHYYRSRRYQGQWHKELEVLFPGYVFMITEDVYALYEALRGVPYFTKLLGDPQNLLPLSDGEVAFLERFGGQEHVTDISVGVVEQDRVCITEGPLSGMEGCITKIDRHKRIARIQVVLFGQPIEATVGVEIVKKV